MNDDAHIDHRIEVIDLRPGDVLFVKSLLRITAQQAHNLMEQMNGKFPENEVVILPPEYEIGFVRHTENA